MPNAARPAAASKNLFMLSLRRFIASFKTEAFLKFTRDRYGDPICAINIADSARNTVSEKQHLEAKCIARKPVFYWGFSDFRGNPPVPLEAHDFAGCMAIPP
jgi:hypothetical protein